MAKALFLATLFVTLAVNLIFLFAAKEKPPDYSGDKEPRRLFQRSDHAYDYSGKQAAKQETSGSNNGSVELQNAELGSGSESEFEFERMEDMRPFDSRRLSIRVQSSRNRVFVSVDNILIYESNPNPKQLSDDPDGTEGRGIHVLVLNQFDGRVMAKRLFDTYSANQDKELCLFLNMVRDGRILVMAVKDEGSFKMAPDSPARELLARLGSQHIGRLRWRDMWALVLRKSAYSNTSARLGDAPDARRPELLERVNLAEGLSKSARFSDWAPPVLLDTQVELLANESACDWRHQGDARENQRRRHFCNTVEGYGRVCDCQFPAPISFNPAQIANSQLTEVPIIVMASNRPYYLYRMLRSLLAVDGVNKSQVTVFIDGFYDEPLMVSQLFDLRAIQQRPRAQRSARISHHYKSSLTAAFELFPKAKFAIIFEEDLDIASDALIYFNQTIGLLEEDASLYCVSAWNDQGYEHTARDNKRLYRIETMPGLGWMLSRNLYKEELEPNWPSADKAHDWDMWIRTEQVRKKRECIIPDISRTFHFGSSGTNINSYFQKQYFSKHAFNLVSIGRESSFANLNELKRENYEKLIEKLVREAKVINSSSINATDYLCSLAKNSVQQANNIDSEQRNNVIYIEMIDKHDFANWLRLAKCWNIWDLDARGQHNSMWRLFLANTPTLVVGAPASPYSRFKPANSTLFKLYNSNH